jgi:hypothetical protein
MSFIAYSKYGADRYLGIVIAVQCRGTRRELVIVRHRDGEIAGYYRRDVSLVIPAQGEG